MVATPAHPLPLPSAVIAIERRARRDAPALEQGAFRQVDGCRHLSWRTVQCWVVFGDAAYGATLRYTARVEHGRVHAEMPDVQR